MAKAMTIDAQRNNAELQLFSARRTLAHLVELYDNGRWRSHYKREEAFAEAVRDARRAVDHWTAVFNRYEAGQAHH